MGFKARREQFGECVILYRKLLHFTSGGLRRVYLGRVAELLTLRYVIRKISLKIGYLDRYNLYNLLRCFPVRLTKVGYALSKR